MAPKHILVVDDDDAVREVIVAIFKEFKYRVSSASNGAQMRDFLATGNPVDCVVLDALMPGEQNSSLALHLQSLGLRVVVVSGSPEAIKLAEENSLHFLQKPFRVQELQEAIEMTFSSAHSGRRDI